MCIKNAFCESIYSTKMYQYGWHLDVTVFLGLSFKFRVTLIGCAIYIDFKMWQRCQAKDQKSIATTVTFITKRI